MTSVKAQVVQRSRLREATGAVKMSNRYQTSVTDERIIDYAAIILSHVSGAMSCRTALALAAPIGDGDGVLVIEAQPDGSRRSWRGDPSDWRNLVRDRSVCLVWRHPDVPSER